MSKVIIVGSHLSGLSTALQLLQAGHQIELWGSDPDNPTGPSLNGYAFWYPCSDPADPRVETWSTFSFTTFQSIAQGENTGVEFKPIIDLRAKNESDPWWARLPDLYRHAEPGELTAQYPCGWVIKQGPVIDPAPYFQWLRAEVTERGGKIIQRPVSSLSECTGAEVVVNCTGLGARALISTGKSPHAERVQVVRMKRRSDFNTVVFDSEGPNGVAVVVPQRDYIKIGGIVDEVESFDPTPGAPDDILSRCSRVVPGLTFSADDIIDVKCCIRPALPGWWPRVELDTSNGTIPIVHNYGHGGSGFTFSHGCADTVRQIIEKL